MLPFLENNRKLIIIDNSNINNVDICCAIGNDKQNQKRIQSNKYYMKERFKQILYFYKITDMISNLFIF